MSFSETASPLTTRVCEKLGESIVRLHFVGETQYSSMFAWKSDFGSVVSAITAFRWKALPPGSVNFDCCAARSARSARGTLFTPLAKADVASAQERKVKANRMYCLRLPRN